MPEFDATLEGQGIAVPFDAKAEFGEARPPVVATVNGLEIRTRLMVYGGVTYVGVRKAQLAQLGLQDGDRVHVTLERDDAPREVVVPPALAQALAADPEAKARFDALTFTHRREYAEWVAEAKRDETRERRVRQTLEKLRSA
jgi:hypothetical protein